MGDIVAQKLWIDRPTENRARRSEKIRSGTFAREFIARWESGQRRYRALLRERGGAWKRRGNIASISDELAKKINDPPALCHERVAAASLILPLFVIPGDNRRDRGVGVGPARR